MSRTHWKVAGTGIRARFFYKCSTKLSITVLRFDKKLSKWSSQSAPNLPTKRDRQFQRRGQDERKAKYLPHYPTFKTLVRLPMPTVLQEWNHDYARILTFSLGCALDLQRITCFGYKSERSILGPIEACIRLGLYGYSFKFMNFGFVFSLKDIWAILALYYFPAVDTVFFEKLSQWNRARIVQMPTHNDEVRLEGDSVVFNVHKCGHFATKGLQPRRF